MTNPDPAGEQWHCPRDDTWSPATSWTIEAEDEPGHRLSWHHCPRGHGFPGRTPYSSPDAVTAARTHQGEPIAPPARLEGPERVVTWERE